MATSYSPVAANGARAWEWVTEDLEQAQRWCQLLNSWVGVDVWEVKGEVSR